MPKFAANLSMLFPELPFVDRFAAASKLGFRGVEYLFPYAYSSGELRGHLDRNHLEQVLFNMPPGDWDAGERGLAALPGREAEFRAGVATAIDYALALDCPRMHVMAGIVPDGADHEAHEQTYLRNLEFAAAEARKIDREILIEPINGIDMPGYFLDRQAQARRIVGLVGAANLRVQFDFYHCQRVEGDLVGNLERQWPVLGHVQIAGVPGRHEPDDGEINYPFIFDRLDALGYRGWIGCEYRPRGDTAAGLTWARPYGIAVTGQEQSTCA